MRQLAFSKRLQGLFVQTHATVTKQKDYESLQACELQARRDVSSSCGHTRTRNVHPRRQRQIKLLCAYISTIFCHSVSLSLPSLRFHLSILYLSISLSLRPSVSMINECWFGKPLLQSAISHEISLVISGCGKLTTSPAFLAEQINLQ